MIKHLDYIPGIQSDILIELSCSENFFENFILILPKPLKLITENYFKTES